MAANERVQEVRAIGRLLAEYNNLEIDLLNCVQMGIGNFDLAFKKMFRERGETKRINIACELGRTAYKKLGLEAEFLHGIEEIRYALQIRNQYAHWTWWDDHSGTLALANLEDLAKESSVVTGLDKLHVHHVDMPLLNAQQAFFIYVDHWLAWVNYEGRFLTKQLDKRHYPKPIVVERPALFQG